MPELITCLVPTRARPEMLKVCTDSLLHRAAHPEWLAEAFPFWFTDTWLDEIALMLGRKAPVRVEWKPQGQRGKTTRMRDLAFWAWVFEAARPERIEDARKLAALAGIGELRGITPNLSLTDPLTAAVLELELSDHGASD